MEYNNRPMHFYSFWSINDKPDYPKLEKQLDELKQAGLNGVVFHPRNYPDEPEYLGKEYMDVVSRIILHAKAIGMAFWLYDENGWPSGTAGGEVLKRHPELVCQWLEMVRDGQGTAADGLEAATGGQETTGDRHETYVKGQGTTGDGQGIAANGREATGDVRETYVKGQGESSDCSCLTTFRYDGLNILPAGSGDGDLYHILLKSKRSVSSLDPKACGYFIEITHERYKNSLAPEAYEYVTGFFSDEVAFLDGHSVSVGLGGVPWAERLPEQYWERYGEDLVTQLPLLFVNGMNSDKVRVRFWELMTDALNDGFYIPVRNWCEANGKRFTAHLKGEESPFFQLSYSGSCFQVLKNATVPAVDALERYPGNNFYPRIAYSTAAQFGNGECLAEAMGGAGWGITPEHFVNYVLWLAGHGINHFVFHINQLRLNSKAVHDWPPSMPCHLTWKVVFPRVLEAIREKAASLPDLREEAQLLIVTPTRGVMASFAPHECMRINEHNGDNIPNTPSGRISTDFLALVEECNTAGIRYELTDERVLEECGKLEHGYLHLGNRAYGRILLSDGCRWSGKGRKLQDSLKGAGIGILQTETWRTAFQLFDEKTVQPPEYAVIEQSPWEAEVPEENLYAVEFTESENRKLSAVIRAEDSAFIGRLELLCLDCMKEAYLDGKPLVRKNTEEGSLFEIPAGYLQNAWRVGRQDNRIGKNTECLGKSIQEEQRDYEEYLLEILPEPGYDKDPVAFIRGGFAVVSLSPYIEKSRDRIMTAGPFVLKPFPYRIENCPNKSADFVRSSGYELAGRAGERAYIPTEHLVEAGLPFCAKPVKARKTFELSEKVENPSIWLTGIKADAARVFIDGAELGWCWGPEWKVKCGSLRSGRHVAEILLIPNTYNVFGPHHHMDGDRRLTSPAQYEGKRNFADRPDAPENTRIREWNFVQFHIRGDLRIK